MFQNWGFLITEMVALIVLAALVGLFAGWLIWGRRIEMGNSEVASRLSAELDECKDTVRTRDARIETLEAELAAVPDLVESGTDDDNRPAALVAPRAGAPDDLKQIKGIGPKLEALCNELGYFHFDQIAVWTEAEVAWMDHNLEGFKGRVTRDNWVAQAKILAEGGETDFAARVKDGDVY